MSALCHHIITYLFYSSILPLPPTPTLFPYTTLFRSFCPQIRNRQQAGCRKRRRRLSANQLRELRSLPRLDRKSTRLNSSHVAISYAVFCLKKKIKRGRVEKRSSRLIWLIAISSH